MTKHASIKTADIVEYETFNIHKLETKIKELLDSPPSPEVKNSLHVIRQILRKRQHIIKAKAMEFELTNDHHILIFDSTENFSKIAGRSVLFYTLTIADRIHRRYSVKRDTDDYYRSENGIVSIRGLAQLEIQLSSIGITADETLSTSELHFYKLPRVYSEEQIAKLHDKSRQDVEHINNIILPKSPLPNLYDLILDTNRLVYYNTKRVSDMTARGTILTQAIIDANEMLISYLNFANAKTNSGLIRRQANYMLQPIFDETAQKPKSTQAQNLFNILLNARDLRNCLANVVNLHLFHHRELYNILEKIVEIEKITSREYAKQLQKDRLKSEAETTS